MIATPPCLEFEVAGCTVQVAVIGGTPELRDAVAEAVEIAAVQYEEAVKAAVFGVDALEPPPEPATAVPDAEPTTAAASANLSTPNHCIGGKGAGCGAKIVASASDICSVYCPWAGVVPPSNCGV
jgi:hypothetical protein